MRINKLFSVFLISLFSFLSVQSQTPLRYSEAREALRSQFREFQQPGVNGAANLKEHRQTTDFTFEGLMGPQDMRITSMVFSPVNEGVIYTTTYENQIFRSTDNGESWELFFTSPVDTRGYAYVRRLSFANPNEPNHLYVSVSDYMDAEDQTIADQDTRGLYILDATTGEILDIMQHFEIQHLKFSEYDVDPNNPDRVVFFSRMGFYYVGPNQTVWITDDGGENFHKIYDYEDHDYIGIWTVNFHPENSDIILLGLAGGPAEDVNHGGFMRSDDGGQTWTYTDTGVKTNSVAFAHNDPNTIYATGECLISDLAKILRSTDGGITWTSLDNFDISEGPDVFNYLVRISTFAHDPFTLWAVTLQEVLLSEDAGETWQVFPLYDPNEYFYWGGHVICADPYDSQRIIIGSDELTIQSFNKGDDWEQMEEPLMDIFSVRATTYPDGSDYLHYTTMGCFYIHDLATDQITDSLQQGWINADKNVYPDKYTQGRMFVSNIPHGIGVTVNVNDDLMQGPFRQVYRDQMAVTLSHVVRDAHEDIYYLVFPTNYIDLYANFYRASDDLEDIKQIQVLDQGFEFIWSISTVEGRPGEVWAFVSSTSDHGIYKSTDFGDTWEKKSEGIPFGRAVLDIDINPNNPDNMVANVSGMGIYITVDGGETWNPTADEFNAYEVMFSKTHHDVVIAREWWQDGVGIFVSYDGGRSWEQLPKDVIQELNYTSMGIIDNDSSIDIYLGAWGAGISKYNLEISRTLTFNVDMANAEGFDPDQHSVYVSGSFGEDLYWEEPGENEQLRMTRTGDSMIYTLTLTLDAGPVQYKYFSDAVGQGWDGGEWEAGDNRSVFLSSNMEVNDTWGLAPVSVPAVEAEISFNIFPNPASSHLNVYSDHNISSVQVINMLGNVVHTARPDSQNARLNVAELTNGVYFVRINTASGSSVQRVVIR